MGDDKCLDLVRKTLVDLGEIEGTSLRDATSHLGEKISRSARGAAGSRDLAVNTQKILGSM